MVRLETVGHFSGLKVTVEREVVEVTSQKVEHFEKGGGETEL